MVVTFLWCNVVLFLHRCFWYLAHLLRRARAWEISTLFFEVPRVVARLSVCSWDPSIELRGSHAQHDLLHTSIHV